LKLGNYSPVAKKLAGVFTSPAVPSTWQPLENENTPAAINFCTPLDYFPKKTLMIEALLIAQLAGPRCGQYGITPENSPFVGCTVPGPIGSSDQYGIRLRYDPLTPAGVRAEPARPASNYSQNY
jgi:hypothetical protein